MSRRGTQRLATQQAAGAANDQPEGGCSNAEAVVDSSVTDASRNGDPLLTWL